MPEEAMDGAMELASGPHFSGLRIDSLRNSSSFSPSSAKAAGTSVAVQTADDESMEASKQPFVIGVSGGTASGKTTVCDMIIQQLHDHRVVLVNQDSFYRGLTAEESERVHEYNFDHPDAFDAEQLLKCMGELKSGQSVNIPIYDFKNHRRCSESFRKVNASDVIILEGILVFHDQRVRDLMDMKIFVDTDADIRLARRIRRDTVERGRDVNSVLEQKYADVIIPRGGDNHVAIDLIVQHIRTKLGQHDLCKIYPNVYVIQSTFQIRGMHTLIRDRDITTPDFVFYSDRLIRLALYTLELTFARNSVECLLSEGNSANQAIELLIKKGVPENRIIFLNLISAPEGIHCVCKRFPTLKIVTSEIDVALNEEFRVIPGLGEFGDRYFGTDN